jgi:hypothetical protein
MLASCLASRDRLFGTYHENDDEYPDTGVRDPDFPHESAETGVICQTWTQTVYPFRYLGGQARIFRQLDGA